jgi:hypothetical protein
MGGNDMHGERLRGRGKFSSSLREEKKIFSVIALLVIDRKLLMRRGGGMGLFPRLG